MPDTTIADDQIIRCGPAEVPTYWVIHLAKAMDPQLAPAAVDLAQSRVSDLGHGIHFAHVRSPRVSEPRIGAYFAPHGSPGWLWLLALIPEATASEHLGWLAHVAAVLHDDEVRDTLKASGDGPALAKAMREALARRPLVPAPAQTQSAPRMRLVACMLRDEDALDHLMTLFVEHGILGATVIPALPMGEHLASHMSLFAGFRTAFKATGRGHLILALIPSERTDEVFALVREAARDLSDEGSGYAWAIDIAASMTAGRPT